MSRKKSTPTLADVAREAGVSPKTVSRVINAEAHVTPKTQARVELAIKALGYTPNLAARVLAASRSYQLALLSRQMNAHVFQAINSNGVRICRERGYHLIVQELGVITSDAIKQLEISLQQAQFEGVILSQLSDVPELLDMLERINLPYVRLLPEHNVSRSHAVSSDAKQGLQELTQHLWDLGHRNIAITNSQAGPQRDLYATLLEQGFRTENIQLLPLHWQQGSSIAGRDLGATLLALSQRPSVIFAFNDEVAASLIGYLWAHGLRVPEDISVAGFDDADIAQLVWPPLTTIRQPFDLMIEAAVKLLLDPAADSTAKHILCPAILKIRQSTAPAITT